MSKDTNNSGFTEFIYPTFNPLNLIDDRNSDYNYRGNVIHSNLKKIYTSLDIEVSMVLMHLGFTMKRSDDIIEAITFSLGTKELEFLSRRGYKESISTMLEHGLICKVNNNNADRRFYINPNIICKLNKSQKAEFSLVHDDYFKPLT